MNNVGLFGGLLSARNNPQCPNPPPQSIRRSFSIIASVVSLISNACVSPVPNTAQTPVRDGGFWKSLTTAAPYRGWDKVPRSMRRHNHTFGGLPFGGGLQR